MSKKATQKSEPAPRQTPPYLIRIGEDPLEWWRLAKIEAGLGRLSIGDVVELASDVIEGVRFGTPGKRGIGDLQDELYEAQDERDTARKEMAAALNCLGHVFTELKYAAMHKDSDAGHVQALAHQVACFDPEENDPDVLAENDRKYRGPHARTESLAALMAEPQVPPGRKRADGTVPKPPSKGRRRKP